MRLAIVNGMFTHRPERLRGVSYIGAQRYFLTFCTFQRARHFVTAEHVDLTLSQIQRAAEQERFAIPAYCFMPDHVHMLVEGLCDSSDLRMFIKLAKQYAGYYFSQATGKRLWQPYAYEHVVRKDESADQIVQYILENPLRQKFVESLLDYPFLGSCTMTREELLQSYK